MQTLERRVASRRVASRSTNSNCKWPTRRDATFDVRDARDATRRNRTKFYLNVEPEASHVASEVVP